MALSLRMCRCGTALAIALAARAQAPRIYQSNWGAVTAPVYGLTGKRFGSAADLFAGPDRFGDYYSGFLPKAVSGQRKRRARGLSGERLHLQ